MISKIPILPLKEFCFLKTLFRLERFVCVLSIYHLDKRIASVKGKVEGYISNKPKGKNGFGYDPIFIPKNKINMSG